MNLPVPDPVPTPPWLESIWTQLSACFRNDRRPPPHALTISGMPGTGRALLADRLAAWLLCLEPAAGGACGKCRNCKLYRAGSHPDLIRVGPDEDSHQIRVGQIRKLIDRLNLSAGLNGWRIAVMHDAAAMNINAANALLKTLEEPGAKTLLLLLGDHQSTLPATIYSRCQLWSIPLPPREDSLAWLNRQSEADPEAIKRALDLAGGAPLRALDLLRDSREIDAAGLIAEGLQALMTDARPVHQVLQAWQDVPAEQCWRWIVHWLHQWSVAGIREIGPQGAALHRVLELYDRAVQGYRLSAAGLRPQLQLADWLYGWRGIGADCAMMMGGKSRR